MDLTIKNTEFVRIGVIDDASDIIWSECYNDVGEFQIDIHATSRNCRYLKADYYVFREKSERVGIIEKIYMQADAENGDYWKVSGRFLECLLERRIIWFQTIFTNKTAEYVIRQFVYENIINSSKKKRNIDNFKLGTSKGYTEVIDSIQRTGTNLLELVMELCKTYNFGFKVILNDLNQFEFSLYKGVNRSEAQEENPHVIFSDGFDNLKSNEYTYSSSDRKNVALVAGEGEGTDRRTISTYENNIETSGMERYEIYADSRDISSNEGEVSISEYDSQLRSRGQEKIVTLTELFDVDLELGNTYTYRDDFIVGDIITAKNDNWGVSVNIRISAMTESEGESGNSLVPTLVN